VPVALHERVADQGHAVAVLEQRKYRDLHIDLDALMDAVVRAKPTGAKGQYIRSVALASTMSPSVILDVGQALAMAGGQ